MSSPTKNRNVCFLLDVGGSFIKSGVMDRSGYILPGSMLTVPVDSDGTSEEIIASLDTAISCGIGFLSDNGLSPEGIGIAIPGPFDYAQGIPLMTHKFRAIHGMDLRKKVYDMAGIDKRVPVVFVHDVNTLLEGELHSGNACGYPNSALIALGTGLGFAFSKDGAVQRSSMGSPLITIFKMPYGDGILEDYVSKRGFIRIYEELTGHAKDSSMTVENIGRLADKNDPAACRTFERVSQILVEGIKDILEEQLIECLLFGGQISKSFSHMEKTLRAGLSDLPALKKITTVKDIGKSAFHGIMHNITNRI